MFVYAALYGIAKKTGKFFSRYLQIFGEFILQKKQNSGRIPLIWFESYVEHVYSSFGPTLTIKPSHRIKYDPFERFKVLACPKCCLYCDDISNLSPKFNYSLHGYMQSFKYFDEYKDEILR